MLSAICDMLARFKADAWLKKAATVSRLGWYVGALFRAEEVHGQDSLSMPDDSLDMEDETMAPGTHMMPNEEWMSAMPPLHTLDHNITRLLGHALEMMIVIVVGGYEPKIARVEIVIAWLKKTTFKDYRFAAPGDEQDDDVVATLGSPGDGRGIIATLGRMKNIVKEKIAAT
jgi:hypothetical protein